MVLDNNWNEVADEEKVQAAWDDATGDDEEETVTLTKSDYQKIQDQLKESTKEWQALLRMTRVQDDKFQFIKLYESDRKLADYVAKKFGEDRTATQVYKDLQAEWKGSKEDKPVGKEADVEAILDKREATATLKALTKEYKLDKAGNEDLKEAILDKYQDFIEWKPFNAETVSRYFKDAVRLVKRLPEHEDKLSLIDKELLGAWGMGNLSADTGKGKSSFFSQLDEKIGVDHKSRYGDKK